MFLNKFKKKSNQKIKIKNKKTKKPNLKQKKISIINNLKTSLFENDEHKEDNIKTSFSFKRYKTYKIIKELNKQRIKTLLFYTDISNILYQLEFGLQPIKNINLKKNNEYIVWTYLENNNYLEFELDNSTRHHFWNWIAEQKVDPSKIAIIAIDIKKLFIWTKKNWEYNNTIHRIKIFENINPLAINWILMKNNQYLNRIQTYIESNNLNIKIFQGEKGNISNNLPKNIKK